MSKWISASGTIIDTSKGQGITAAGTYSLLRTEMDRSRPFIFAAKVKEAGHTATLQLVSDVLGVQTNLGSPLVPTFGSPAADTEETSLTGERAIVVSGITGAVYPEAVQ